MTTTKYLVEVNGTSGRGTDTLYATRRDAAAKAKALAARNNWATRVVAIKDVPSHVDHLYSYGPDDTSALYA